MCFNLASGKNSKACSGEEKEHTAFVVDFEKIGETSGLGIQDSELQGMGLHALPWHALSIPVQH